MIDKIVQINRHVDYVPDPQTILFINNFDSFVYNLVNYLCMFPNVKVKVVPNTISIEEIKSGHYDKIMISPGPGHPKYETGSVIPIIQKFASKIPIFGVCLGHQAMGEAFGEDQKFEYVGRAKVGPKHGKMSRIFHDNEGLFEGLPNPIQVVRYHSLAIKADTLPKCLKITAIADDGTIMGVRHREFPCYGVQFHPESVMMIPFGKLIIQNFVKIKVQF